MNSNNIDAVSLLRDIMVDATTKIHLTPGSEDVLGALQERLHFTKREDWMVFGSCLYTFEDAAMAIRGYFATAKEKREKDFEYLRLFGFLNACYLQLGAICGLCTVVNVTNKKNILQHLAEHRLIHCRNMLASHTLAYKKAGATYSITIEQVSLGGTTATFIVNETSEKQTCSFQQIYASWSLEARSVLMQIVEKFVQTVYMPNKEKQAQYLERVDGLRNTET